MTEHVVPGLAFDSGVPPLSLDRLDENPTTPRFALSYQADPSALFYVSASKGFRLGGGNAGLASFCDLPNAPTTFRSDEDWSYEVGAKNTLFNGRLQVDSSAFYIDWLHIQQSLIVPSCGLQYTTNAGSAVVKGFDLSLKAQLTDRLRINIKAGYVDAYYGNNVYDPSGSLIIRQGDAIGVVPQRNVSMTLQHLGS
jgi:iron complex outermembrane recepter protein